MLFYSRLQNMISSSERVEHSYQVQLHISELFINLRAAISSQRGYLLSGDTLYLRNYKNYHTRTYEEWYKVDSLASDNQVQKKNLDTLYRLLEKRFDVVDRMLTVYQTASKKTTIFQNDLPEDKNSTIQLLQKLRDIRAEEAKIMQGRITYKNASEQLMPILLFAFILVALLLLLVSFLMLRKELAHRFVFQRELEEKVIALNTSNRELEQFAYIASHDLQEPLRKIMTFSTLLKMKQKDRLSEEGNQHLDIITNISRRMKRLIEDLLMFSRTVNNDDGRVQTDLGQILKQVMEDLSEVIVQHRATITYEALPSVWAYPSQMQQLFQNLITNSLKYSRAEVAPVITITASLAPAHEITEQGNGISERVFHKIEFKDNGIGFEQKYADQIFAIFQRLHTHETYSGTGVGLAICKRIVSNHAGYIQATATPNEGAIFSIYLPMYDGKPGKVEEPGFAI